MIPKPQLLRSLSVVPTIRLTSSILCSSYKVCDGAESGRSDLQQRVILLIKIEEFSEMHVAHRDSSLLAPGRSRTVKVRRLNSGRQTSVWRTKVVTFRSRTVDVERMVSATCLIRRSESDAALLKEIYE